MTNEDRYEEFEKRMAEKYPRYFGKDCHYGGFAIGEGWYLIIETLISQIDSYTKWKRNLRAHELRQIRAQKKGREALLKFESRGREPTLWDEERVDDIMMSGIKEPIPTVHWITVQQIKEKFGGLRFYYSGGDDYINGLVRMAESWADESCETCGNKGTRRSGGWIRTLCDAHEQERQETIRNMK